MRKHFTSILPKLLAPVQLLLVDADVVQAQHEVLLAGGVLAREVAVLLKGEAVGVTGASSLVDEVWVQTEDTKLGPRSILQPLCSCHRSEDWASSGDIIGMGVIQVVRLTLAVQEEADSALLVPLGGLECHIGIGNQQVSSILTLFTTATTFLLGCVTFSLWQQFQSSLKLHSLGFDQSEQSLH